MRISNVAATTDDALSFFSAVNTTLKRMFSDSGYILGQCDIALCDRGDFVEIPGARWYAINGRVGDRHGHVKQFRKEFAARIGPDTDRQDISDLAWSIVKETCEEYGKGMATGAGRIILE